MKVFCPEELSGGTQISIPAREPFCIGVSVDVLTSWALKAACSCGQNSRAGHGASRYAAGASMRAVKDVRTYVEARLLVTGKFRELELRLSRGSEGGYW